MAMSRELGMGDTYVKFCYEFANGTTGVCSVIQIKGPLNEDLVRRGLNLMQKRHPLLRAFLSQNEKGKNCISVDDEPQKLSLEIIKRKGEEHWREIYESHLNVPIDVVKEYLWRSTFLFNEENDTHEIVASFHHTIIDGRSIGYFHRDLMRYFAAMADGKTLEVVSLPFLPNAEAIEKKRISWEEYLAGSVQGFEQFAKIAGDLYEYEKDAPLLERKTRIVYRHLDADQLSLLLKNVRENKTTLTSLLSAAQMIALHKVRNPDIERWQTTLTPVDMRSYCEPEISDEHIGGYVSIVRNIHSIGPQTSLWDLAREFNRQLMNSFDEQAYSPAQFAEDIYLKMLGSMSSGPFAGKYGLGASVTNYGILDLNEVYGPFKINFLYSGATRHAGDWLSLLHTATFNGRLYLCFCYEDPLLSPQTAEKMVQNFDELMNLPCSPE